MVAKNVDDLLKDQVNHRPDVPQRSQSSPANRLWGSRFKGINVVRENGARPGIIGFPFRSPFHSETLSHVGYPFSEFFQHPVMESKLPKTAGFPICYAFSRWGNAR